MRAPFPPVRRGAAVVRALVPLLSLALLSSAVAQPARRFVLGGDGVSWETGGGHRDPTVLVTRRGYGTSEDTTNTPGGAIDFVHRPGWIGPLYFDPDENISGRALQGEGSITLDGTFYGEESARQLTGMVNGDHLVAFELKPDIFNTAPKTRDVWVILDFAVPVGAHRVRFYPRNTVVPTPERPYQEEYLRAYELWVNPTLTDLAAPDRLVRRDTGTERPVVDVEMSPQYVRLVKVRSLTTVPFELDEVEVYGTGYMAQGTYLSDILDLGERASIGPVRWVEEVVGDPLFSKLSVRMRTGADGTPIRYRRVVRDFQGSITGFSDVAPAAYYALDRSDRVALEEDSKNWSPWTKLDAGDLPAAPVPRRYAQLRLEFEGGLFATRQVDRLELEYLVPPIADSLLAEVYPRLAEAEKPATFRYAVRLEADGPIRGYDRIEVDTNVGVTAVREARLDGRPVDLQVESSRPDGFSLRLPFVVDRDGAVLEFTFDLPIFRFGTTFSGRASSTAVPTVPQRLDPGDATDFGPGDFTELSGLFVAIPRKQLGRLVGEVGLSSRILTPNGDGHNDRLEIDFNLLQLVEPAPVTLDLYDLGGRLVHRLFAEERGIGPVRHEWDGRLADGSRVLAGLYIWVLRVRADAFEERHAGTLGVAY